MNEIKENIIAISPYKSFYKAAACISFDLETCAVDYFSAYERIKQF